ncbi:Ig-like domain-containing protein, partial [Staphylococcus chromogenes]|uniref:Ig-like domain-containing protein n=1 Tax=Staphylococcus chromogenes TaxID=46126 RepID=UPI000D4C18DA
PPPAPTDSTRPTVSLSSPTANASFTSGSITHSATATDNVGVSVVEFYLDGVLAGTGGSSAKANTYTFSKAASELSNGTHTIYAVARDVVGNSQQSSSVTVTVNISTGGGTVSGRFNTLPVNATLPSETDCSA